MTELFNNLKTAILEAIDCAKSEYKDEPSSDAPGEELECMECDGMTPAPKELSRDVEEELETNMLLRDLGRGGN